MERIEKYIFFEIIKHYPNPYFGKEHEYEKTMWGNYVHPNHPHTFIDASCFKNSESCFTVGIFEENNEEEPDFRSVGSRIVVEPEEINHLHILVQHFYVNRLWEKEKRED